MNLGIPCPISASTLFLLNQNTVWVSYRPCKLSIFFQATIGISTFISVHGTNCFASHSDILVPCLAMFSS